MVNIEKYEYGSDDWFEMLKRESLRVIADTTWPKNFRLSVMERFRDVVLPSGEHDGFRMDIHGSEGFFRRGAGATEIADVIIDLTFDAAKRLTRMLTTDPVYEDAFARLVESGDFVVTGSIEAFYATSIKIHDAVSSRTL